jgi:hypothetical protein
VSHPEDVDLKARSVGLVYVLRPFVGDRPTIPFEHNVGTRLMLDLDHTYHFPQPQVRAFLSEVEQDLNKIRAWCNAAWVGEPPPRRKDTWERVFAVLREREGYGATCAEVQRIIGLGHGAVSGVLCRWDAAGVVCRLAEAA